MFKHATFVIQQPEAEHSRKNHPQNYRDMWDFPGARLELLQGEDAEILPGITCVFTPGHTPGHQSILLEADGRRQLFVGDAVYTVDIWQNPETMTEDHPSWRAQGANAGWTESADKLRALDADVTHFAHDTKILQRSSGG
jgi:glyoxylase-like metal-dependent hydrolase (beta-lactamase superfamily II)